MNRTECLKMADEIINKDRAEDYGDALVNFGDIARLWSAYLEKDILPSQVADMMILLKIARRKNGRPKNDTYIDICGYAALGCEFMGIEKTVKSIEDYCKVDADAVYDSYINFNIPSRNADGSITLDFDVKGEKADGTTRS